MNAPSSTTVPAVPAAGDPADEAIPALFEAYGGMVRGLGLRLSGSPAEADEIVQDTFLSAYRGWPGFDGRSKPSTWLYTIAVRAWKRRRRGRKGRDAKMPSLEAVLPFADTEAAMLERDGSPPAQVERRETVARMQEALAELPDAFRIPLLLKDLLELSVEETARVLDVKPQTVKTRLHRARLALRKTLIEGLPTRPAPKPRFERQQCVDLLRAKLESMDRGESFPRQRELICDRCRGVFDELDLAQRFCLDLDAAGARDQMTEALGRLEASLAADRRRDAARGTGTRSRRSAATARPGL